MNSPPQETRKHPRVRIPLLVQYRFSPLDPFNTDYASDISESGIFITHAEPKPPGTPVFLQFVTRDGFHLVSAEGKVVRNAPGGGQGVHFIRLEPQDLDRLQELVQRLLGNAQSSG